jgi:hypothetical protein
MATATKPITAKEARLLAVPATVFRGRLLDWSSPLARAQWHPELEAALAALFPGFKAKPGFPAHSLCHRLADEFDHLTKQGYLQRSGTQWLILPPAADLREVMEGER